MDILILAILSLFIFYKLSKQLGKIDEDEKINIQKKLEARKSQIEEILNQVQKSQQTQQNQEKQQKEEKVIGAGSTIENEDDLAGFDYAVKENLKKIFSQCNIDLQFFLNGAKMAFEMTIKAFCDNDLETLKNLLSEKIYKGFEAAINHRISEKKTLVTNLIAIDKVEIQSANIVANDASIIVKFTTRQINYINDIDGKVAEGRKDEICEIIDVWTFKKDITSNNPNWLISSTSN